jgi:acetate kinase
MILVFNVGSTSIKYKLYDEKKIEVVGEKLENSKDFNLQKFIISLVSNNHISSVSRIKMICHRVVFGGQKYTKPLILSSENLKDLELLNEIAPLHNPPTLKLIKDIFIAYPMLKQMAFFDTSFHQTLEPKTFLYGLPYEYFEKYGVRKYGFHGISHGSVAKKVAQLKIPSSSRIISCHLGGGCSVCAIKDGKSVDTSMGFSPEEGLIMATRSGNVGAGALEYLQKKLDLKSEEMLDVLNQKSGLLGISGVSGDMRELLASDEPQAKLAIEVYCLNIAKTVGSYIPQLGGLDVLVFTGGVGEGSSVIREKICDYLSYLDLYLYSKVNRQSKEVCEVKSISTNHSKVKVMIIQADEERAMIDQSIEQK